MVVVRLKSVSWTSLGIIALAVLNALVSDNVVAMAQPSPAVEPLHALVQRLFPKAYHGVFDFQLVSEITPPTAQNKYDVYRVSNKGSPSKKTSILIEGTSLSALGRGLKYYLDQAVEVELVWSGNRFNELPKNPPRVPDLELDTNKTVTDGHVRGSLVPWRYYTNVVSFGYQFAFWDWQRWEREIDWMVLNGVNMLPAMVGQEYVFREFYRGLNLTDEEINSFLTGPSFMPWQRMGNIQGSWNHKLLNSSAANELVYKNKWIDKQWELQKLILGRIQALDIKAVLPTFQAFVPRALEKKFPEAVFKKSSQWQQFPIEYTCVTYVKQTDPLFATLLTKFLALQQKLNGGYPSHHYLLDLYNELIPDCLTPECLKATTVSVTNALHSVDKKAVWAMQGWFLTDTNVWTPEATKAYFDGIQSVNGSAFIMDLAADTMPVWDDTDGFYGNEWGWSIINNFGTAQGLFGNARHILKNVFEVFQKYPNNFKGIGVATEGVNNNEYIYNTVFDLAWHDPKSTIDPVSHLERFVRRRYGPSRVTPLVRDAWKKLLDTVWDSPITKGSQSKSYIEKIPDLHMNTTSWLGTIFVYHKPTVVQAWDQLVRAALREQRGKVPDSFEFDLVDTTREVLLATVLEGLQRRLVAGYKANDAKKVRAEGRRIVSLIRDADRLLNTSPFFSFGAFVKEAKDSIDPVRRGRWEPQVTFEGNVGPGGSRSGPTKAGYQHFLESNARNIMTWWGPTGNGTLVDYASKQWGGLLTSYYLPRWTLFIAQLEESVVSKTPWNRPAYLKQTLAREAKWQAEVWGRRPGETGVTNGQETVEVVREIWEKWGKVAFEIAATAGKE